MLSQIHQLIIIDDCDSAMFSNLASSIEKLEVSIYLKFTQSTSFGGYQNWRSHFECF
jgi:hypothetical protein